MSDGYIRHHETGSVKHQKRQEKEEKQKRLAASCSILGFVKNDKETSGTGTVAATDIPFPGRSGPPAQSTESNNITTAAGDLIYECDASNYGWYYCGYWYWKWYCYERFFSTSNPWWWDNSSSYHLMWINFIPVSSIWQIPYSLQTSVPWPTRQLIWPCIQVSTDQQPLTRIYPRHFFSQHGQKLLF